MINFRFIFFILLLSFSLFGEEDNQKVSFGTGLGLEYGVLGFQTSMELFSGNRVFFSALPIQPYIHALGVSSDLYFLKDTNFRTHLTYGTTSWGYSTYQNMTNQSLGFSTGVNYYFYKPYKGWHFGLDYVLSETDYKYHFKGFGFSKWSKSGDNIYRDSSLLRWSLGYKF
jgi:hypothetical protein